MKMKSNILKIVVIVVLAAVLVGISVIKSNISAKRSSEKMQLLKEEYFNTHDSLLLEQLDDTTRLYVDSIQQLEAFFAAQIDSLNNYHAEKESLLSAEVKEQKAKAAAATKKKTTPKKKKSSKPSVSSRVKSDYKSLVGRLPSDLTVYENRVSVNEIIVELAKKYKLSPEKVKKYVK